MRPSPVLASLHHMEVGDLMVPGPGENVHICASATLVLPSPDLRQSPTLSASSTTLSQFHIRLKTVFLFGIWDMIDQVLLWLFRLQHRKPVQNNGAMWSSTWHKMSHNILHWLHHSLQPFYLAIGCSNHTRPVWIQATQSEFWHVCSSKLKWWGNYKVKTV